MYSPDAQMCSFGTGRPKRYTDYKILTLIQRKNAGTILKRHDVQVISISL